MEYKYSLEELQNEKIYLLADSKSDIIKDIMNVSLERKDSLCLSGIKYNKCINDYNDLIKFAAKLIRELNVGNNSIVLSMVIRELIFNGYFSNKNIFEPVMSRNYYDVYGFEGLDIVNGKGCCRHVVSFYNDLFKKLGVFNYITPCYITTDKNVCLNDAFGMGANHVLSSISYDDAIYGYDCYTNAFLKFIDAFTMLEIFDNNSKFETLKCYYKPSVEAMMYGLTYNGMYERLKCFRESSTKNYIDYSMYLEFKCNALDIYHNNKRLLKDFKRETKKLTRKISSELAVVSSIK